MGKIIFSTDLCDTLVKGNTTFIFLDSYLSENRKYKLYKKIKKNIVIRFILKILFLIKVDINRYIALGFIKGVPKETLVSHLDTIFAYKFVFNNDVLSALLNSKKKNNNTYIVSASLDFIVEYISHKLDVNFLSTTLKYKNNICLGKIEKDLLFSKKTEFLKKINGKNGKILFISDNREDVQLLKHADYGFGFFNKKNELCFMKNKITPFNITQVNEIINNE
ncbi:HAD family hydrolase [Morganella morganii]|nr:HAD family hydrolase [Morganella morganii]